MNHYKKSYCLDRKAILSFFFFSSLEGTQRYCKIAFDYILCGLLFFTYVSTNNYYQHGYFIDDTGITNMWNAEGYDVFLLFILFPVYNIWLLNLIHHLQKPFTKTYIIHKTRRRIDNNNEGHLCKIVIFLFVGKEELF